MKREYSKGAQFVFDFIKKIIDKFGPRLPASEEERAAARQMAEEMQQATGKPVKMEPFITAPRANIGSIPILGLCGFIAAALYYINPIASLALVVLIFVFAVVQILKYKEWFSFLFRKQESQNFYSVIDGSDKIDYTIVYSGHTDSSWNWNMALKKPLIMIPKVGVGALGLLVILGLSITRIILKNYSVDFTSTRNIIFFVIPIVFLIGFYWISIFLSYDKSIASPGAMDNLSGVGMAILMGKYFKENPEDLPKNCRIIVAALGSEEAGLKGSSAFMKEHKEDKELLINPYIFHRVLLNKYNRDSNISDNQVHSQVASPPTANILMLC
jgi:hypothetical protein